MFPSDSLVHCFLASTRPSHHPSLSVVEQRMAFGDVQHARQCDERFLEPRGGGCIGGRPGSTEGHGAGDPETIHDPTRPLLSAFPEPDPEMATASCLGWESEIPEGCRLDPSDQGRDQEIRTAVIPSIILGMRIIILNTQIVSHKRERKKKTRNEKKKKWMSQSLDQDHSSFIQVASNQEVKKKRDKDKQIDPRLLLHGGDFHSRSEWSPRDTDFHEILSEDDTAFGFGSLGRVQSFQDEVFQICPRGKI